MIYAVDRYLDVIKVKLERETVPGFSGLQDKYHYFDSEPHAKTFIRARAEKELAVAERRLRAAQARVRKCERKFSFQLQLSQPYTREERE